MIIAIDGPAGVGKSSLARALSQSLGFILLNSGQFYRCLTHEAQKRKIDRSAEPALLSCWDALSLGMDSSGRLLCDGKHEAELWHTTAVDREVSQVSAFPGVRSRINARLRQLAQGKKVLSEGRDIGTEVFPEADLKIFLDADPSIRAQRRLTERPEGRSLEDWIQDIQNRDKADRSKPIGALRQAEDAILVDTSDLTFDEVYDRVVAIIRDRFRQESRSVMGETENQNTLQEEFMRNLPTLEEGALIEGTVIAVTSDNVILDVGYKSDGNINLEEFDVPPRVGDKIKVRLIKLEGRNGNIQVSKRSADEFAFRDVLAQAVGNKTPLKGKIVKSIKGGFEVDLGSGYTAFLPLSKTDVSRVETPEDYLGVEGIFLVEKYEGGKKANIVVNRRDFLIEETTRRRDEFFSHVQIGDEVEGVVKSFTSFGAFIDLGGFDGLLHINDMSWGHVTRPKDFVKKGDKIKLKVIRLDQEEKRINLSLKHFSEDPWNHFEDKFAKGDLVKGQVTKLTDFGAFIEIEEGIEGLAHISELSWVKRVSHPKEILKIGDPVEAKILDYDIQQGRISLGLKQVNPNPWESLTTKYPLGKVLSLEVKKITAAGAFLEVEEGIDGFLALEDWSWTKKPKSLNGEITEGQKIDVKILEVDGENKRIRLGVKQISEDPWNSLKDGYPRGSLIEGVVTNKTDFGVFVKVPGEIEGLVPKSHLVDSRDADPEEALKKISVGDTVKAVVLEVNVEKQKLGLSIKDYIRQEQKQEISRYIHSDDDDSSFSLGDLLKKN